MVLLNKEQSNADHLMAVGNANWSYHPVDAVCPLMLEGATNRVWKRRFALDGNSHSLSFYCWLCLCATDSHGDEPSFKFKGMRREKAG
jgi:hypothetical protein